MPGFIVGGYHFLLAFAAAYFLPVSFTQIESYRRDRHQRQIHHRNDDRADFVGGGEKPRAFFFD